MNLKRITLILFITCGLHFYATRLAYSQSILPDSTKGKISLLFTGDIMGHGAQIAAAYNKETGNYEYDSCFLFIKPFLEQADFAIGNLEVTLAGPPYKGYPQFSSPDGLAVALKNSGFDVLVTANNHAADRGFKGASRTLRILDSLEFMHTGTFSDAAARDSLVPLLLEKNGIRIALLNYTYGINGLPMPLPVIVAHIDTARMAMEIKKCKDLQADFIIAELHWGNEYERVPNAAQKRLADWLFSKGVMAVIGSHPHVIQPIFDESIQIKSIVIGPGLNQYNEILPETKKDISRNSLVVWSMGNLVSNQPERYRNGGIMVSLDLVKDSLTSISNVSYVPVFVYRRNTAGSRHFFLLPAADWLSGRIQFPVQAPELILMKQFDEDTRIHLKDARLKTLPVLP
jgi:poly-gamma-glutamate capsule biosynthesis protein CapA/YwtB (metallophosphatase superfamily)